MVRERRAHPKPVPRLSQTRHKRARSPRGGAADRRPFGPSLSRHFMPRPVRSGRCRFGLTAIDGARQFREQCGLGASGAEPKPVYGMTEIAFDEHALPPWLRKGLFPAASLPHLDLSLVWLDQANTEICAALEQAGFA